MEALGTIKKRKSVRTYNSLEISSEELALLKKLAMNLKGPFDVPFRFKFFQTRSNTAIQKEGFRVWTYGVIRGAKHFVAGIVKQGDHDLEQIGYVMEHLILHATDMNLGTCWLGGTFNKKFLGTELGLEEDELMPAITPLGYQAKNESLISKAMKWGARSTSRTNWSNLFFSDFAMNEFTPSDAASFALPLEMVRLAPSASNNQPWRIIKDNNFFHFFLHENKITSKALGFTLQRVDIGIAMCHFELSTRYLQLKGWWETLQNIPLVPERPHWQYIISWHL